tara:strand:- start:2819 stop:3868 length:1050 start_codon:yes stop_codon:yes gene_type:complete
MRKILLLLLILPFSLYSQISVKDRLKKTLKFSTFYAAYNGNNSISDITSYSVLDGLKTTTTSTPYDYSAVFGIRKIQRFGYEPNIQNRFKNGTENSFSDAATVGSKSKGFEYLFEFDYRRQQGKQFLNQDHFVRYIADNYIFKVEYLEDGFADIGYFESSQRLRHKFNRKFSINIGAMQRISEPYGFDPFADCVRPDGSIPWMKISTDMGYNYDLNGIYTNSAGEVVANSTEVFQEVVVPQILSDYANQQRNSLPNKWEHSLVLGFDYYKYSKSFWLHSWANLLPYHLDLDDEFSYHKFNDGQWLDYSGGLIFGYRFNRSLGIFTEGRYHKYWNRSWYEFSTGINYIIL